MDIKERTHSDKLERYSFIWSEVRLIIAAIALFLGGVPPVLKFFPIPGLYGTISSILTVCWIISGLAAGYLLYRWYANHQKIFGGKGHRDTTMFFVSIVSGLNLGITGVLGINIGMSISSNKIIFVIIGVLYLFTAVHLFRRWKSSEEKIF